jgi:hypothetical protein
MEVDLPLSVNKSRRLTVMDGVSVRRVRDTSRGAGLQFPASHVRP